MTLKLHFHPLASFCWKVLIALYENDTPFEPVIVDLGEEKSRAAFLKLWPHGKFPLLQDTARDRLMPESAIIIDYLDQYYPGRVTFIPADRDLAREARLADQFYDRYVHEQMQKIVADKIRPEGSKDPYGVRAGARHARRFLSDDRRGHARQAVGRRRDLHARRLRCLSRAVLCQQGRALRRQIPACRPLSRAAVGSGRRSSAC